jgi:hypothetical protein
MKRLNLAKKLINEGITFHRFWCPALPSGDTSSCVTNAPKNRNRNVAECEIN